jgi:two-component system nitrate/nitrite response regulator NarL
VLHALRRERLTTRVVLVSATVEVEAADAARAAGACAYVSKASSHEAICAAVAGAAGGRPAPSDASRPERGPARFERPLLSPRELEVLRLVAEGRSGPEIGRALHLSPETIKTHLKSAYEKLGVSERAAAVAEGMRRGVLE